MGPLAKRRQLGTEVDLVEEFWQAVGERDDDPWQEQEIVCGVSGTAPKSKSDSDPRLDGRVPCFRIESAVGIA